MILFLNVSITVEGPIAQFDPFIFLVYILLTAHLDHEL
jgi:hypothetical protein